MEEQLPQRYNEDMYVRVHVIPDAKRETFIVRSETVFDISVKEPAQRNLANKRIIELVAQHFNLPSGKVRIITGHRSVTKVFDVAVY